MRTISYIFLLIFITACNKGSEDVLSREELHQFVVDVVEERGVDARWITVEGVDYARYLDAVEAGQPVLEIMRADIIESLDTLRRFNAETEAYLESTSPAKESVIPDALQKKLDAGFQSQEDFDAWAVKYPNFMISEENKHLLDGSINER